VQQDCEQAKCLLLEAATEDHCGKFLCKKSDQQLLNPSQVWRSGSKCIKLSTIYQVTAHKMDKYKAELCSIFQYSKQACGHSNSKT